jgi:chitinase
MGYNFQILAFTSGINDAAISSGQTVPHMQLYGNMFLAYTSYNSMNDTYRTMITDDIALAKQDYGLKSIVVSVGGETGSVKFSGKNLTNIALNIIHFCDYFTLDGIDFDLENTLDNSGQ